MEDNKYTYRVIWSNEDKGYIGLCAEFPSLSWLEDTREEALWGIKTVAGLSLLDMRENNEPIPEPRRGSKHGG